MSRFVLVGRMTARPGQREDLLELLGRMLELAAEHEPGLAVANVHASETEEDVVMLYEQYDDEAAFREHLANYERVPAYAEGRQQLAGLLAQPPQSERFRFASGYTRSGP